MFNKVLPGHFLCQIIKSVKYDHHLGTISQKIRRYSSAKRTNSTILEIHNGVGGSEAMLFASEMLSIYMKYCLSKSWPHQLVEKDSSDLGGIKQAKLIISAAESFENLIQEAGVHRVQRVPKTEKNGRMHTSTITIAVVPESVLDIKVNEKDIDWQFMRSSGPGGQHVNKIESAVRLTHRPSKLVIESQESRHQLDNKRTALKRLKERLQMVELEKLTSQSEGMKRAQQGNADRNEKIRTYNFPHDRITDHRIGKSYYNLKSLMGGDISILDEIIKDYHQK